MKNSADLVNYNRCPAMKLQRRYLGLSQGTANNSADALFDNLFADFRRVNVWSRVIIKQLTNSCEICVCCLFMYCPRLSRRKTPIYKKTQRCFGLLITCDVWSDCHLRLSDTRDELRTEGLLTHLQEQMSHWFTSPGWHKDVGWHHLPAGDLP